MRRSRARDTLTGLLAAESGGFALWLPPFLSVGIAVYFSLRVEPPLAVALLAAGVAAVATILAWRSRWRPLAVILLAVLSGFAAASVRTAVVEAPRLEKQLPPAKVSGVIVDIDPEPTRARVILDDLVIQRMPAGGTPGRARIRLTDAGSDLAVGTLVEVLAELRPPPPPIMPGAFDFQRKAYYDGIGAFGYGLGPATVLRPATEGGPLAGAGRWIAGLRRDITDRVGGLAPGDPAAAVAAALLTGHRGYIDDATLAAMRDAGIAHLLAISGLHIGLVAGLFFGAIRIGIALTPRLALRVDGKKAAAVVAMLGATVYAVLAGLTVPTERALIMTGLVLTGVLIDRRTLSLRTVALAAGAILLAAPESLTQPGFQMSFAAVTALIAVHAELRARRRGTAPKGQSRRVIGYIGGVLLMTIIASAATTPFAIFHFQHASTFGLIANLVAVPLAAFWIMPSGVAALLAMPVGADGPFLHLMVAGTHVMLAVARTVAAWPATSADLPAPAVWGIAAVALGGLLLALLRTRLRLLGAPLLIAGYLAPFAGTVPDIVVDGQARVVAVKGEAGLLMLSSARRARFETAGWRRRAGERDDTAWPADPEHPMSGLRCDARGCFLRRGGIGLGLVIDGSSTEDDCRLADLIVALEPLPRRCKPPKGRIDRFDLWRNGTHAIWINPDGSVRISSVNEERGNRPWTDAPRPKGRQ